MLEEKLDLLTKEITLLRKAIEANGPGSAGTAADASDKPAAAKKAGRPAKAAAPEPTHTTEEVDGVVRKVSKLVGRDFAKSLIAGFKCDDLADLLTHPEHLDGAYDQAVAALLEAGFDENGEKIETDDDI